MEFSAERCFLIYDFVNADRGEVPKGSAEIFFRKVKFWKEDGQEEAPPVFVGIILPRNVWHGLIFLEYLEL